LIHLSWRNTRRFLAIIAALSGLASATSATAAVKIDPKEIMRVEEVRPGMKGVGRTVFQGVKIEPFDVTVLGVLPKENLGRPLILVRMDGGPIVKREANIIGGMSGSPVYIKGRLVGAVAYGMTFPREPIAMLTPIEDMLEALDPALPDKPSWASERHASVPGLLTSPLGPGERELKSPVRIGDRTYERIAFRAQPYHVKDARQPRPGTLEMAPIATPAMVSGISQRSLERLTETFAPFGVQPVSGPGAMKYDKPIPLVPGSAAGASLVVGDIDMTAVGTVTYRKGNQILAFGHPFLQMGAVDLPLTTAWVHDVFPSIHSSFKIASPVQIVGSVRQDRPWGISAHIGQQSDLIPLEATVKDYGSQRRQTIRARVIDNRFITPQLIAMVANEAIFRIRSVPGDATARVRTRITTDRLGTIERENLYYDALGIDAAALGDLLTALGMLNNNPWERVGIRGVQLDVNIDNSRRTAVIESAVVDRVKYQPGDVVQVNVTLRPWEREPTKRTLSVRIPEYAPNGHVTLRVHGGSASGLPMAAQAGAGGAMMRTAPSPLPAATSLRQMVQQYLEKERNDELVATLALPSFTANIDGQKMSAVPPTLLEVMRNPRNSGVRLQNDEVKASDVTPWVISGMAAVSLTIERKSYSEKAGAPSAPPMPQPQQPQPAPSPAPGGPQPALEMGLPDAGVLPDGVSGASALSRPDSMVRFAAIQSEPVSPKGEAKLPPTPAGEAAAESKQEQKSGADGKKEEAKKPEVDASAPVKAAGRSPMVWRQESAEAFERGQLDGVAVSTRGEVTLAPSIQKVCSLDATYVWSLLAAKDALYAGTGDRGVVYRIAGESATPVLKTGELQVLALAQDAAGNLYAGTAPRGSLYRLTPEGKSELFWRSPEQYILSLAVDAQGNLYAGTSPHGGVYRITPDGKGELLARIPDPYVVSLAVSGANLYASGGMGAVVYRITDDRKVSTLFDPGQGTTASLITVDPTGQLYVGTSPRGALYRVEPDGRATLLHEKSSAGINAIAADGRGALWAAAGDTIYRVSGSPERPVVEKIQPPVAPRFLALATDEAGRVAVGSATGDVYRLAAGSPRRGVLESAVRDAGSVARWGRLTWQARVPAGTRVVLQTRTGNSGEPDATWSPWSAEQTRSGATVASPPGRYFQYRAILTSEDPSVQPVLSEVAVVYLAHNQKPKLTVQAPKSGDVWSRKQTIRWSGTDPDKDTLLYDVYYSGDEGASWTRLNRIVKEAPAGTPENGPAGNGAAPSAKAPAAPPAAGGKGGATKAPAAAMSPAPANSSNAPAPGAPKRQDPSLKETSFTWDTTEVPDGRYLVKIVASDRLSNPADPASVEEIIGPILISNTPPKLALQGDPAADEAGCIHLAGTATAGVPLAGVDYRIDAEEWASAEAEDGIFDSETERFRVKTTALDAGEHTIEIRAVDAAGNHVVEKRKVTIP